MRTHELSFPVYEYVRGVYKGEGKALGEIASEARSFESDLNVWNEDRDLREGYEDER